MNLIEKYIEVVTETQGFQYKREIVDHINECLGTQYPYTVLNNWASVKNPRPVPPAVVALMRQAVLPRLIEEQKGRVSRNRAQKYVDLINSESAMREQVVKTFLEDETGKKVSSVRLKSVMQALEVPHIRT